MASHTQSLVGRLAVWGLILAGDVLALWRGYRAATWYRAFRRERLFDPSGAELYLLNAQIDGAVAVVGLVLAGAGVALMLRAERRGTDETTPGD